MHHTRVIGSSSLRYNAINCTRWAKKSQLLNVIILRLESRDHFNRWQTAVKQVVSIIRIETICGPPQLPSFHNSFPVIRAANAKNRRFHVPQPTFLFSLETPLRLSRNVLHGWKGNSMLARPLAACGYLSSIVSELYDA